MFSTSTLTKAACVGLLTLAAASCNATGQDSLPSPDAVHPCGPRCLDLVLSRYARQGALGAFPEGGSGSQLDLGAMQRACERVGLNARQVRLDVRQLEAYLIAHSSACAILSLKSGHFCYLDAARDGQFHCASLSGEARWYPADKLAAIWPGEALLVCQDPPPNDAAGPQAAASATAGQTPLRIVYFHSPSCHECQRVKDFLPQVADRWGDRITLELHSIEDISVFNELLQYERHYQTTVSSPPAIFVGRKALIGDETIMRQLNDAIADAMAGGLQTFCPPPTAQPTADDAAAPCEILNRFQSFGPGAVAVAGLIDGVNPCAFTTIVFFLSMLAYLKKTRREMLVVGAGFTAGMFAAYFLLGVGLLTAVKTFSVSHGVSSGLACGVAGLSFALAGWSLIDAIRYMRTGDAKQATLGLPKRLKDRIHRVIRTGLTTRGLVIGSVSVGFLVSILESLCTGQVYLPTIVFMTRAPGLRTAAWSYLLLYNVMFILPLVGVLVMTYLGVRSEKLGNLLRKRLALVKLGMAGLFAGLGVLVITTL